MKIIISSASSEQEQVPQPNSYRIDIYQNCELPGIMAVSWVYRLRKDQLEEELRRHRINSEGSLATLRQRMVGYVRANPELFEDKPRDGPDYEEDLEDRPNDLEAMEEELRRDREASSPLVPGRESYHDTVEEMDCLPTSSKILDQMRKWICHFDGKNVYAFLERLKELQRTYQFSDQQILRGFPELLRGDAQLWYHNCVTAITSLEELEGNLRAFYLSPSELRHLDRQIYDHHQGPKETIRGYVTTLQTLMRRRGGFTAKRAIETLYYNMRPGLRLYIRLSEISSLNDLIQRIEDVEEIQRQQTKEIRTDPKTAIRPQRQPTSTVEPAYNREDCCWRLSSEDIPDTTVRPKKFCSRCGRDGIFSRDCACKRLGNERRAGPIQAPPRPEATPKTRSQEFSSQ